MPDVHSFGIDPITCHAWNHDRTQVALSPNNNQVHIYRWTAGRWQCTDVLSEHIQKVTSVDWAPRSNRIVTCGVDRNAYVWTLQADGKWEPALVILRINRAATCVKWSPKETKFAVGSGARLISVCYFAEENNWWVSKHIKKPIRSTVTCLDWHPNNVLLASGSTDFKARVFSSYIKEIDDKPGPTSWGTKMPFGQVMSEVGNGAGGWIHSVSFSEDGNRLAFVGHDSTISVVDATQDMQLFTLRTNCLPFRSVTWVTENSILTGGYDYVPIMFAFNGREVSLVARLDESESKAQSGPKFSAMNHFRSLDSRAASNENSSSTVDSVHQNAITQISLYSGTKAACSKFSTSSVDGQIVIWDLKSLSSSIAGLRIA